MWRTRAGGRGWLWAKSDGELDLRRANRSRLPCVSETIPIVDDTPANLGVLVETLGAVGDQLMVAEVGEEALA